MVQKITVGTAAVKIPVGQADRPVLQNLGPGDVYFGTSNAVSAANGLKLTVGMGYEFPDTLSKVAGWNEVWVIASEAATDLRIANVG